MKKLYLISLACLCLLSCNRNSFVEDPKETIQFDYLEPISLINDIDDDWTSTFNDSLSTHTRNAIDKLLIPHAHHRITFKNDSITLDRLADLDDVMIQYQGIGIVDFVEIPESLKAVFRKSNSPYTIGILNEGNNLSRKVSRNVNATSFLLGVLTGGGTIGFPNLKSHYFNVAIFDNKAEKMLGYMTLESKRKWDEPVDMRKIEKQVARALRRLQNKDIERLKRQRLYLSRMVLRW